MKSPKWFWGGIGLQLGVGYTVAYFVYTIGTLLTEPQSLNITAAICGFSAILIMALVIVLLIGNARKEEK